MYTQIQSFNFNGAAEEVFAFLRRDGETQQYTDGDYTFVYRVASEPAIHSVINIAMNVGLIRARCKDEDPDGTDPECIPHPCAKLELRLSQTWPGACLGNLFIHLTDLDSVAASQGLTSDEAEAAIHRFIAESWRQMIAYWEVYKRKGTVTPVGSATRSPGGRPRNDDDDWAYEQVVVLGRPRPEVYREWLGRIGERANLLAGPQESFKQAIAARVKKPPNK